MTLLKIKGRKRVLFSRFIVLGAVKKSPKLIGQLSLSLHLLSFFLEARAGVSPALVQFVQISRYTEPELGLSRSQHNPEK